VLPHDLLSVVSTTVGGSVPVFGDDADGGTIYSVAIGGLRGSDGVRGSYGLRGGDGVRGSDGLRDSDGVRGSVV